MVSSSLKMTNLKIKVFILVLIIIYYLLFYVLFNDTLNTFLINGYIGVGNILIEKIPSGYQTGIDLRLTTCQTGAYTTRLSRRPLVLINVINKNKNINIKDYLFTSDDTYRVLTGVQPSRPRETEWLNRWSCGETQTPTEYCQTSGFVASE